MRAIRIERAVLDAFGGKDALDNRVEAFRKAIADHPFTVDVPAPTEHPFIEEIARFTSAENPYTIVEPPEPEPVPEPSISPVASDEPSVVDLAGMKFEDLRAYRIAQLKTSRQLSIALGRVDFKKAVFLTNAGTVHALTLNALTLGENDVIRWRVASGEFIELSKADVLQLLNLIRAKIQNAFNKEARLSDEIRALRQRSDLMTYDPEKAWAG